MSVTAGAAKGELRVPAPGLAAQGLWPELGSPPPPPLPSHQHSLGFTFFGYEVMTLPACLHHHCRARIKQTASAQPRWPSECLGVSGALGTGPWYGGTL